MFSLPQTYMNGNRVGALELFIACNVPFSKRCRDCGRYFTSSGFALPYLQDTVLCGIKTIDAAAPCSQGEENPELSPSKLDSARPSIWLTHLGDFSALVLQRLFHALQAPHLHNHLAVKSHLGRLFGLNFHLSRCSTP